MNNTGKYIGINQKIQFDVLDAGIYRYLQNKHVNKDDFTHHVREFIKGENRVRKTAGYAMQIFKKQEKLLKLLQKNLDAPSYSLIPEHERKALILCLLALTYPITYNLLNTLGAIFKVQDTINRGTITQKMALHYGSNRSLFIAMDSLIQMFMEFNRIKRVKLGLYASQPTSTINNVFITELIIYTDIKLSESKTILCDDIKHRSIYWHFDLTFNKNQIYSLIKYKDSSIGRDYITI